MSLIFDLLNSELVRNVSRGTDHLPDNFCFYVTLTRTELERATHTDIDMPPPQHLGVQTATSTSERSVVAEKPDSSEVGTVGRQNAAEQTSQLYTITL